MNSFSVADQVKATVANQVQLCAHKCQALANLLNKPFDIKNEKNKYLSEVHEIIKNLAETIGYFTIKVERTATIREMFENIRGELAHLWSAIEPETILPHESKI